MDDEAIRVALQRHWSDINDQEIVHEIYHDDVIVEFPQSGERILGRANLRAMREVYPTALTFTITRMRGGGDLWITESIITYNGKPSNTVNIMEFRDDKVAHETIYVAEPWEPPGWRAQWVDVAG